jgi:hypothetical protein
MSSSISAGDHWDSTWSKDESRSRVLETLKTFENSQATKTYVGVHLLRATTSSESFFMKLIALMSEALLAVLRIKYLSSLSCAIYKSYCR